MIEVIQGDTLHAMRDWPDACIDAVVCDPPYGLSREPDIVEVLRHWMADDLRNHVVNTLECGDFDGDTPEGLARTLFGESDYQHRGGGFMGKSWDSFVPGPSIWREIMRVLKPGGHVLAFYGTRTYDLGVIAMRLAGFEIRDQLDWLYGQGMPKSKNPGRAIDMHLCHEPGRHYETTLPKGDKAKPGDHLCPRTPEGDPFRDRGTGLSPSHEPIVLARKPLIGTVAENVLAHGTGGINVDACRIGNEVLPEQRAGQAQIGTFERSDMVTPERVGRWPANVLLDEHAAALLDEQSGTTRSGTQTKPKGTGGIWTTETGQAPAGPQYGDSGGASRFFYVAKSAKKEREAGLDHLPIRSGGELTDRQDGSDGLNSPRAGAGRKGGRRNTHPTVKPIALMRWLVRLITPPGGIVLDPFAGSGSTLCAAALEGMRAIGIELDETHVEIARARVAHWREPQGAA